jgi:hypothetical protein
MIVIFTTLKLIIVRSDHEQKGIFKHIRGRKSKVQAIWKESRSVYKINSYKRETLSSLKIKAIEINFESIITDDNLKF